ncbi:MAG: hypothetical protein MPJ24_08370, partial [Pirellulaceae bacterium]|nr:hypothetical protein [Pirellulaceae bacterium]
MFLRLLGLGLVLFLSAPSYSYAIVVSTTTFNTTIGPEGLDVYDNVGVIINGSHRGTGTYLGDGWVLTAAHVGAGDITLGGVSYSPIDATVGSAFTKQLDNPDDSILAGAEQKSDLLMYKIAGTPILSTVSIGTAPIISDVVTMVGAGWNVEDLNNDNIPDKHYFDSDFNEVIEGGHAFSGYLKGSGHAKRWGQNYVSMVDQLLIHDDIFDTVSFVTTFSDSGTSITNEAQAVPGDSGGAVVKSAGGGSGGVDVR